MDYHEVRITNRATRHTWTVSPYCESVADAIRLTHLTFNPINFEVVDAKAPKQVPPAKVGEQQDLF